MALTETWSWKRLSPPPSLSYPARWPCSGVRPSSSRSRSCLQPALPSSPLSAEAYWKGHFEMKIMSVKYLLVGSHWLTIGLAITLVLSPRFLICAAPGPTTLTLNFEERCHQILPGSPSFSPFQLPGPHNPLMGCWRGISREQILGQE